MNGSFTMLFIRPIRHCRYPTSVKCNSSWTERASFWPRIAATLAMSWALIAAATAAQAQSNTGTFDAKVGLIEPLSITKLADLDFGDLVVTTGGTIVLSPTIAPTCTTTGGVIHSGQCQPAAFGGSASSGARVRVRRPIGRTITLSGPGDDMTVTDITINGGSTLTPVQSNPNWERFTINAPDGTFIFRVGGTLNVNPGQAPGIYTGTFDIRLDYQ